MGRQGVEIGGDVAGDVRTAVDATDAARREDPHTDRCGEGDGRTHRGRPELPTLGNGHGEVALGGLPCETQDALVLSRS